MALRGERGGIFWLHFSAVANGLLTDLHMGKKHDSVDMSITAIENWIFSVWGI